MSGNSLDLCLFNCLDFSNLDVWTSSGSFVPWLSGPRPDLLCLGCLDLVRIFCALDVWTLSGSSCLGCLDLSGPLYLGGRDL